MMESRSTGRPAWRTRSRGCPGSLPRSADSRSRRVRQDSTGSDDQTDARRVCRSSDGAQRPERARDRRSCSMSHAWKGKVSRRQTLYQVQSIDMVHPRPHGAHHVRETGAPVEAEQPTRWPIEGAFGRGLQPPQRLRTTTEPLRPWPGRPPSIACDRSGCRESPATPCRRPVSTVVRWRRGLTANRYASR